jgi:hypothetical protein
MRAFFDSDEITDVCQRITRKPSLNGIWSAEVLLPSSEMPAITKGVTELIVTDSAGTTELHVGRAYFGEDDGDADSKNITVTSQDPRAFWDRKQVMDPDGDFSDPSIIQDNENAVDIMAAAINNSIANDGAMDVTVGTTEGGGVPLVGYKPVDWPMTIKDLWELLVETGELDTVLNPASGGASTVDLYNGDFGADLSGSVQFDYGTGAFNCTGAKYTWDMAPVITRLRLLLGPKRPQFDGDIQHWAGDVQKDDPGLPDPPQTAIDALIAAGEAAWGLLREVRVDDSEGDENDLRDLYERLWQSEMIIRLVPRRLLNVTPEPGILPTFVCGDIIGVAAVLSESLSGAQRVYDMTIDQDPEGNETISQLVVSADQET